MLTLTKGRERGFYLAQVAANLERHKSLRFSSRAKREAQWQPQNIVETLPQGLPQKDMEIFPQPTAEPLLIVVPDSVEPDVETLPQREYDPLNVTPQLLDCSILTERQRQVCLMLSRGMLHKEIAATLDCGKRTVEQARADVAALIGIHTKLIVVWCVENRRALLEGGASC